MVEQVLDHSYCSLTTAVQAELGAWLQLCATLAAYVHGLLDGSCLDNHVLRLWRYLLVWLLLVWVLLVWLLILFRLVLWLLGSILRGWVRLDRCATGEAELGVGC